MTEIGARTPLTAEIAAVARDPMVPLYQETLSPRDETLARRGGRDVGFYDEIRRDPHAHAVLQKRTAEVVSREWTVTPASGRRRDRYAADLVSGQIGAMAFDRLTMGLMEAVLKGYAVAEVIWAHEGTEWRADVRMRRAQRFRFTAAGEVRLITRDAMLHGMAVPDRRFIVHRYAIDHTDDDPYGLGLGSVLFWPAWFKRQVLSYWLRATEKFAAPTPIATYSGDYDEIRQKQVQEALRAAMNGGGLVVPESVKVDLLEAMKAAGGSHGDLARYLDEMMSEAVLGETLTTSAGDKGARALGEVHNGVRLAIAKADADLVCATLNRTLVRWICALNTPEAKPPTVWRDFSEPEDLDKRAERDTKIKGLGFRPSLGYIIETYGGDWNETRPEAVPPATAALFADAADAMPTDAAADRLDRAAQPILDRMITRIRTEVMAATSREDLAERLLAILPDLDVADLAGVMELAIQEAQLTGRAAVLEEASAREGA